MHFSNVAAAFFATVITENSIMRARSNRLWVKLILEGRLGMRFSRRLIKHGRAPPVPPLLNSDYREPVRRRERDARNIRLFAAGETS
ncbi:MAG TPA: hypothetical protein VHX19_21990, partial [Stellaceae bacterium]|nr:hypothetical protein [Stellaceae bacterium]